MQKENKSTQVKSTTAGTNQTNATKKKYQYIWKILFILITIIAGILINKIYIFQTHQYFKDIRQGGVSQLLIYGITFAIAFTIFDLFIHYCFDDLCAKYYINDQIYSIPDKKIKRCYTLVKWGYSIGYYLISSIWAYRILITTSFMPTWLGGFGNPLTLHLNAPLIPEATLQMKVFYICQAGKHFSRFFSHVFIRPEGNFFQYSLHHGLSVFLIVFSYLSNQWLIGIFVLLVHDYSDFALILARGYKDFKNKNKKILDIIYIHATSSWIICRIILFSYCCIYASIYCYIKTLQRLTEFEISVLGFPYAFMCLMMVGLELLNLFWTYYVAESFFSVKISSKTVHAYD